MIRYAIVLVMALESTVMPGAEPAARFRQHTIASDLRGGYQVVAVDLNKDGKPDLIALASGMRELVWFENPGWERHVIAGGRSRMINLAAHDWDGDGIPEIVLAEGFDMDPRRSTGTISFLKHGGDPREPWSVTEIDRLPSSHRLRLADIEGSGRPVVVNAPLANAAAEPPEYKRNVPLVFYRPGQWKREIVSDDLMGVMHGIFVTDWDGKGRDSILTASFLGVHLFHPDRNGGWTKTELTKASPLPWPKCGASDVAVGHAGKLRFLCTIEPWHGNQAVVYTQEDSKWERHVIEEGLVNGHTIHAADLNGDGRDEIIVGFRDKPQNLYVFSAEDAAGARWRRETLDEGGMGAASCAVADLNGDGRPDIACIDSTRLKWYENLGR